jgi:hypothetical protein
VLLLLLLLCLLLLLLELLPLACRCCCICHRSLCPCVPLCALLLQGSETWSLTVLLVLLMACTAAVRADWYCASSTVYTTLTLTRPATSSGTTRRSSGLVLVNSPLLGPVQGENGKRAGNRRTEAVSTGRWSSAAQEGVRDQHMCRTVLLGPACRLTLRCCYPRASTAKMDADQVPAPCFGRAAGASSNLLLQQQLG